MGLQLQYLDSQIAEAVMLILMKQDVPCLPIHDSFIVPRDKAAQLRQAMQVAFADIMGAQATLKDVEPFDTDFRVMFTGDKDTDFHKIQQLFHGSKHSQYVGSRHTAIQEQGKRKKGQSTPPIM